MKQPLSYEQQIERDIRRTKRVGLVVVIVFGFALLFLIGSVAVITWQYEERPTLDSAAWITDNEQRYAEITDALR